MKCNLVILWCEIIILASGSVIPDTENNDDRLSYSILNKTGDPLQQKENDVVVIKPLRIQDKDFSNLMSDSDNSSNCSKSEDDFPKFIFNDDQVKHGGVVLCVLIGIYCFTLLARVCKDYFIPCVETISEILNLSPNVTAATFMSIATSTPELFTNMIGTFITQSDIGIGTIVGSSIFNGLGVAAVGGLAAPFTLQLDWWPLTRDCSIYICAILTLITITWDGIIMWYEALVLFIMYFLYFTLMFQNDRIARFVKGKFEKKSKTPKNVVLDPPPEKEEVARVSVLSAYGTYLDQNAPGFEEKRRQTLEKLHKQQIEDAMMPLFRKPKGSKSDICIFYYTWPIQLVLRYTIPNSRLHPKMFPLTFLMCIIWIGMNAYMVSWMITILGNLFSLPDAVMGMTFLAVGGCLPECLSMIIIARSGEAAFGVSNSLGANTMNILFSLGMPWFFKNMVNGATTARPIKIQSGSIEYTIMALILVSICLYTTLAINKFQLSKKVGYILLTFYLTMASLAILSEMVFFDNNNACSS